MDTKVKAILGAVEDALGDDGDMQRVRHAVGIERIAGALERLVEVAEATDRRAERIESFGVERQEKVDTLIEELAKQVGGVIAAMMRAPASPAPCGCKEPPPAPTGGSR